MKPWQILIAIGIGSFLGIVVVCGGLGAWFVINVNRQMNTGGGMFNNGMYGPGFATPVGITYTLTGPAQATQGERFTLVCTIENTLTTPQALHSLQNYSGLTIHSVDPPPQTVPGDWTMLIFNTPLPPNQPQTFHLECSSEMIATQEVNIDANINDPGTYIEAWHTIQILPPAAE